jgi:hypothetical protein
MDRTQRRPASSTEIGAGGAPDAEPVNNTHGRATAAWQALVLACMALAFFE